MKLINEILIYLMIGIIVYFLDIHYTNYDKDCTSTPSKKIAFHTTVLLHHLIICFTVLTCLFSKNKLMIFCVLILSMIIFFQWKLFKMCVLTSASTKLCNGKYTWKMTYVVKKHLVENEYYLYVILISIMLLKLVYL